MSVNLNFTSPTNYNLSQYQIGQSISNSGALSIVASGTDIGSYPNWINNLAYSGGSDYWYAVRFVTDDNLTTAWSERMHGKYGAGIGYFILNPSGSNTIYLIPPPSSGSAESPTWLNYNHEYTVTLTASGLYGTGKDYMEEDYSFFFTSTYCPLWSTVDSVRMTVGPIIDDIPDDTINRMIFKASQRAMSQFLNGTNPYGCEYTSIPEQLYRWVTCMAGLHALNAAIAGGGGTGNTSKRLGTMTITYEGGTSGATPGDTRKTLQDCVYESASLISALLGTRVKYAIQSVSNQYARHPLADKRWGRMPRKIEDNGLNGPWTNDPRDHSTYTE